MHRDAVISDCGTFRYRLTRVWDAALPKLLFVMLNPSTADDQKNDPTVTKCIGFATRLGYGGVTIVNLFAFRATDPVNLRLGGYQTGPENNRYIREAMSTHRSVVFAWGSMKSMARASAMQIGTVRAIAKQYERTPMALRMSNGSPHHPLMLPYSCTAQMIDFERNYEMYLQAEEI